MSVLVSDLIMAIFNCKDIADARMVDLQRVIDSGGRVDPDLSYEQDRREERFKILLDRYIDERIKIAVESDQRTIHDVSGSPLDVVDCGTHVRPAAHREAEEGGEEEVMPTGYTAKITEGQTFEEFVLRSARAMGALIMMRDDPLDAPIPDEFKPSDYHAKEATECRRKLEMLRGYTDAICESAANSEYEDAVANRRRRIEKSTTDRAAYEAMLARVYAWEPPTTDHVGFKDFMIEQIRESIKFDCISEDEAERYYPEPVRKSGEVWRATETARLSERLAENERMHAEEVERTERRNAWVRALRESLPKKGAKKR